jgi:hypothetical protein
LVLEASAGCGYGAEGIVEAVELEEGDNLGVVGS